MTDFTATIRGTTFAGTLADLSQAYSRLRDESGEGMSTFRAAIVRDRRGHASGHISYNGRIWPGFPHEWHSALTPLFDNRDPTPPIDGFTDLDSVALNDWYEQHIGYRPQQNDPSISDDELRAMIRSYVEEADHAMGG